MDIQSFTNLRMLCKSPRIIINNYASRLNSISIIDTIIMRLLTHIPPNPVFVYCASISLKCVTCFICVYTSSKIPCNLMFLASTYRCLHNILLKVDVHASSKNVSITIFCGCDFTSCNLVNTQHNDNHP